MDNIAARLKALSNENRLAIFQYLRQKELACCDDSEQGCCVGDIAEQFDLALSTVSHHLKVLKDAGMIKCTQHGQQVYCAINEDAIHGLVRFLSSEQ